ncbi:microcystin-dependent protein [Xenorhabdus cabanillasii]|uniref:Microcystin-dependent protein n=1 Tax=Xenorhabdus cabanillasii TaxID=351673 RepID=A0A3D9UFQ1_9GAMM|nr:tail fiber protein [Xenorhabdus cabanillasii]REF28298.1 microcystin-dependent protein [Xenorhabdus cabanillasii]
MKEIRYSVKTQEQQTLTDSKGIGPETDKLKDKFKDGSIPLQTDFNQLIDIADIGRRATGQAPGQSGEPGNGLSLTDDGTLQTVVNSTGGLHFDKKALAIKPYYGINVDNNGVSVKAGDGIKVDNNGVSIDSNKILPNGMIVMFSGNSAPAGWAFCDGNNGTPDLRSRFVMCGETISETGKSSSKATGSGSGKNYSRNTTSTQVSVTVNVQYTMLTESQIPSHRHIGGMAYYMNSGMQYGNSFGPGTSTDVINNNPYSVGMTKATSPRYAYTSNTGEGQGHNHQATALSPSHSHSVNVVPPYYLLAFIMKL